MAEKNTQPFYKGAGGTDGEGTSWPLRPSPYYSRVEDQEIDFEESSFGDRSKNYQFIAFRPGFSLQASELNEMQEHFQMQLTLTMNMYHNWITSGITSIFNPWSSTSIGGYGGDIPPSDAWKGTSIGQGGGYAADGTIQHDSSKTITAPGWRGACPLYPYDCPYQGPTDNMSSVTVIDNSAGKLIRFNPGWWLVDLRRPWDGDVNNQPAEISGLKHWIYLNNSTEDGSYEIQITNSDMEIGNEIVAGLRLESDYYTCEEDPDLADNASGVPNSASCGADRYGVSVLSADKAVAIGGNWGSQTDTEGPFVDRENISLVCKVDLSDNTIRYMNNMIIHKF